MLFHDLIAHKGYADASMLQAVRQHPAAAADTSVRVLLHHMLVANRFWLLSILGEPFAHDQETRIPDTLDEVVAAFRMTHERELACVADIEETRLSQWLEDPRIPGGRCLVSDALLQVCLHSQGHRSQVAKLLRALGATPPMTDYILWRVDRPSSAWPA